MSDEIVARLRLEGQRAFDAGLDRVAAKMTAVGDAATAGTKAATRAYERMTTSLLATGEALDGHLERIDALRLATVAYADEQLELSEQWVKDGDVLRAQVHTLRRLRGELIGTARAMRQLRGAGGLGGAGGVGGRRYGRRPGAAGALGIADRTRRRAFGHPVQRGARRGGPAGNVEAREARRAARRYARAWRAALARARDFRVAGRVAGRVTASTMAATAAAAGRVFFARFRKQWHATGVRTGIVVGNAAGMTAGLVTAGMMTSSLANAMQRFAGMFNAIATSFGIQFGTQAGKAAGNAFVINFLAAVQSVQGIEIGGGKKDDGGGFFGKLKDIGGDVIGATPIGGIVRGAKMGLDAASLGVEIAKKTAGGVEGLARALGGGARLTKFLKPIPLVGNAVTATQLAWELAKLYGTGQGDPKKLALLSSQLVPVIGNYSAAAQLGWELADTVGGGGGGGGGGWDPTQPYGRNPSDGFARGGRVRTTRVALVGERGPEIVQLPGGANVVPAHRSRQMLEQRDARVIRPRRDLHIHQHLDGREIARATLRNIDSEEQWR